MKAPLRILCQHDHGSCAACCGVYNFRDRTPAAERARLERRSERVRAAWPNVDALARVRDDLLAVEKPDVLFAGVKVCPFAGYLDDGGAANEGERRVGCMIHPSRHPQGEDLRDLAVYPREVCEGHFCAPHDWLRDREADLAQTATGTLYGRVVTDAGLVKALARLLDQALGRSFARADITRADAALQDALAQLWSLVDTWPLRDPDPARFGGFVFAGNEAVERSLPSSVAGLDVDATHRTVLDALGTRPLDDATEAVRMIDDAIAAVARAIDA
jgi:hypothetical protein